MTPVPTHLTRAAYIDRSVHDRYTPHKREGLPFAAAIPCAGWPFSLDAPPFGEDAFMTKSEQSYVNMPDSESPLDVEPVGGRIGAEVRGIALSRVADESTI